MPTYISLVSYTDEGIQQIRESPDRLDAARALGESLGVELHEFYLTMGQYDAVVLIEAPDEETATTYALRVGSDGAVATETLLAFEEDEFRDIIARLPE